MVGEARLYYEESYTGHEMKLLSCLLLPVSLMISFTAGPDSQWQCVCAEVGWDRHGVRCVEGVVLCVCSVAGSAVV